MMQEKDGIKYFFDTYAIAEIINGDSNYARFSLEPVIITIFNLAEVYWISINQYSEQEADEIYLRYSRCVVDISEDVLKEAIKFRKKNKSKNLSYTDCIGYIYALKNNLMFLTGDKEFKDLKNVEFVK
ncbi:MAG TPA: PIN domain-containing protein [Candidatus Nanoarchaeia archaeon]|nr:PIN domain-containing protein [Candidatus Nanoarchaeia archaeon]